MISPSESQKPGTAKALIKATELQIRRMRKEDLPQVMGIESVSFGRHHWSEDSFLHEMKNQLGRYYSILHTDSGQLLGYCGYWLIFDEVHITTVAVQPESRGLSLGEIQIVHIIDRCMGHSAKWITLEVRVSNFKAQNLYYKYGFQSVGMRAKYYQDNQEDALIMTTNDISTAQYRALFKKNKEQLMDRLGGLPQGFAQ